MTVDEMPEVLTAKHIAEHLHLSKVRVYELMRLSVSSGGIPSFVIGKSCRARKNEYLAWINGLGKAVKT